jgi:hypothetical protein
MFKRGFAKRSDFRIDGLNDDRRAIFKPTGLAKYADA